MARRPSNLKELELITKDEWAKIPVETCKKLHRSPLPTPSTPPALQCPPPASPPSYSRLLHPCYLLQPRSSPSLLYGVRHELVRYCCAPVLDTSLASVCKYLDIQWAMEKPNPNLHSDPNPNPNLNIYTKPGPALLLQHLDSPGTFNRDLFVNFGSGFNTVVPQLLYGKLFRLAVPDFMCWWNVDFLTKKETAGATRKTYIRPPDTQYSPVLFSLYTNNCVSKRPAEKILKFAHRGGPHSQQRRVCIQKSSSRSPGAAAITCCSKHKRQRRWGR
ncbi:hypothetical protein NFI96_022654 [Prochilodus magdalenae]|nr:hypothetical protein NFI96_022654 [Prochilodus magdalenae]